MGQGVRGLISLFYFVVWCPLCEVTSIGDGKDLLYDVIAHLQGSLAPLYVFQSSSQLLGEHI